MTIGLGFLCRDGIVLCADRQITGLAGYKFEECKLFYCINDWGTMVFGYAGDPEAAKVMFDKINDNLQLLIGKSKARTSGRKIRGALETIFNSRNSKGLETLVGIRLEHGTLHMFRTSGKKVRDGITESIGGGDGSALQYVCHIVLGPSLGLHEAEVMGSYIVSVANRYVEGCSGGPDVTSVHADGSVTESSSIMPNQKERFAYCEEQIGAGLRELLFSGGTKKVVISKQ